MYGLDINPIAVELARVSIWIHTFVRGLPMSSLDHNASAVNQKRPRFQRGIEMGLRRRIYGLNGSDQCLNRGALNIGLFKKTFQRS